MLRFMTLTFLILGWAFYEASGGAEFVTPATATVAPVIADSRADLSPEMEPRLVGVAAPAPTRPDPRPEALPDAMPVEIVARAATDFARAAPQVAAAHVAAAALPPPLVLREVTGSRVNLRAGPGTVHDVVTVLPRGTVLELVDDAGDWSQLRAEDGTTGWMANSLLRAI